MSTEIPKSISGPRCTRRRGVKLWAVNSSALGSYGGRQPQILQFHLYQEERRARAGFRGDRAFVVLSIMQRGRADRPENVQIRHGPVPRSAALCEPRLAEYNGHCALAGLR